MVITIDGVQKLKGHLFCGREIERVTAETLFKSKNYVFHFPPIEGYTPTAYSQWEDAFAIHLVREPKEGIYQLYWMGLHSVTCQQLNKEYIENFNTFYSYFEKVVRLGKGYWDDNK